MRQVWSGRSIGLLNPPAPVPLRTLVPMGEVEMLVHDAVSAAEVREQALDLLPPRAAMAFINIAPVTAVNLAIAVNAATIGSYAAAGAWQGTGVAQR
jgi:hypothetical protein